MLIEDVILEQRPGLTIRSVLRTLRGVNKLKRSAPQKSKLSTLDVLERGYMRLFEKETASFVVIFARTVANLELVQGISSSRVAQEFPRMSFPSSFRHNDGRLPPPIIIPMGHRPQNPFTPRENRLPLQHQGPPMNAPRFDSQAHRMNPPSFHPQPDPRCAVPPGPITPYVSHGHPEVYHQSQGPRPVFQPPGPNPRREPAQEPPPFVRPPPDPIQSNRYEDDIYLDEGGNGFQNDDRGSRYIKEEFRYTNDWPQNRLRNPPERSDQNFQKHPRQSSAFEHDDPRNRSMSSEKGPLQSYQDTSRKNSNRFQKRKAFSTTDGENFPRTVQRRPRAKPFEMGFLRYQADGSQAARFRVELLDFTR
ncbi:hypothetical protein Landi51_12748 [Colletotrichum acutatum]